MSIWTSLLTGTNGLNAYEQAIGVVGDNIANVSTTAYRASRASFEDILGGSAANGQRNGAGVRMSGPEMMLGPGALQQTGRDLDLAVRGNGFFVLQGEHNGIHGQYFTRDGRFKLDKDGFVVNNEGLRLRGYMLDPTGNAVPTEGDLAIATQGPPRATQNAELQLNLLASAVPPADPFDPAAAETTSNYSTSMDVFDSLGQRHRADVYFRTAGNGTWEWYAFVDGAETTGGTAGTRVQIAGGTLTFDGDGNLSLQQPTAGLDADFINANQNQVINFDFTGTTQNAGDFDVRSADEDGFPPGTLVGLDITDDGTLFARYSNGERASTARIALAAFGEEGALRRAGGQLYTATRESGDPSIAAAGTGQRGAVSAATLEGSNVDLGAELVTLIAYQRAFQANAKTVTSADEVLTELTNLKR